MAKFMATLILAPVGEPLDRHELLVKFIVQGEDGEEFAAENYEESGVLVYKPVNFTVIPQVVEPQPDPNVKIELGQDCIMAENAELKIKILLGK